MGLEDVIEIRGRVGAEDVESTIASASCLINPSEREGYGVVVVEAASMGTPTILVRGSEERGNRVRGAGSQRECCCLPRSSGDRRSGGRCGSRRRFATRIDTRLVCEVSPLSPSRLIEQVEEAYVELHPVERASAHTFRLTKGSHAAKARTLASWPALAFGPARDDASPGHHRLVSDRLDLEALVREQVAKGCAGERSAVGVVVPNPTLGVGG